jgi:hypothetical protein
MTGGRGGAAVRQNTFPSAFLTHTQSLLSPKSHGGVPWLSRRDHRHFEVQKSFKIIYFCLFRNSAVVFKRHHLAFFKLKKSLQDFSQFPFLDLLFFEQNYDLTSPHFKGIIFGTIFKADNSWFINLVP